MPDKKDVDYIRRVLDDTIEMCIRCKKDRFKRCNECAVQCIFEAAKYWDAYYVRAPENEHKRGSK